MAAARSTARLAPAVAALVLAASSPALATSAASSSHGLRHSLLSSRELWATIDVCAPADQARTIGIRGSMPGDGRSKDKMYMSFHLQFQDKTSKRWADVAGAGSKFASVGGGGSPRQGGYSYTLMAGKSRFELRAVVEYEWRRGATVLQSATRLTAAGHTNASGADPSGYSAATCSLG